MKPHFAPGTWVARKTDFNDGLVTICHSGDWRVGVETGIKGGNYRDTDCGSDEGNARLMAAAPELLANLEFAVKLLSGLPGLRGSAQVEHMRAVIAKATVCGEH